MSQIRFWRPGSSAPQQQILQERQEPSSVVYNSYADLSLENQRKRLPIFNYRNHILYLLENHRTLIIVGETGSGKSTQIPQYIIESGWVDSQMKQRIAITEPRRVAAVSLASRVAEERLSVLGEDVGYAIRFDECLNHETTVIKFITDGVLLREIMTDPLLNQYSVILVDEAHERSLNTDLCLGLLKKIQKQRPNLRLIISSATIDADKFHDFFNSKENGSNTCAILSVEGRNHPVDVYYTVDPVPDYVTATVETIMKIHVSSNHGDVLAFLTGRDEVDKAVTMTVERARAAAANGMKKYLKVMPMYSTLPIHEQIKIFEKTSKIARKVVIATNIAETSITIEGVVYIIDCGFVKLKGYNPQTGIESLLVCPISKSSAEQRAGRAGRCRLGRAYRLYREEDFEHLDDITVPEMKRSSLAPVVLQLKNLGVENIARFDFMSPPPAQSIINALEVLFALDALDSNGHLTENVGHQIAEFPLNPLFAKMIINSSLFDCSEEIVSIAAMLQVNNIFSVPTNNKVQAAKEHRKFSVKEGDHLTLLNVFNAFVKEGNESRNWCNRYYLNFKALKRAVQIRLQLVKYLNRFKINLISCEHDTEKVLRCIASGFFPNAARLHPDGTYRSLKGNHSLSVHPSSVLATELPPPYVVFNEVLQTSSYFMRDVSYFLVYNPHPCKINPFRFKFIRLHSSMYNSQGNPALLYSYRATSNYPLTNAPNLLFEYVLYAYLVIAVGKIIMDIINNPTDSNLLAVNINDNISFLHVSPGFSATETLMKNEEYSLENISMPDMALPIDMHTVKCMCWCSSSGCFTADSLALGFGSGKVLLWPHVQQNSCIASPTEFIPHGNRACTCLAWNSGQPNQIAIGMERSRAESSLLVWDIMSEYNTTGSSHSMDRGKQQNTETYSTTGTHRSTKRSNFSKPVFESCFSESVNSVLWAKHDPKLMILGTNGKHLKILDIRTIKPTNAMVNTKSVFGICQDPCFDMRLASFHENQVCVWDLRSFTKPAAIIPMRNNVIKVEWCPTRTGLLATAGCGLSEDGIIRLYDTTHAMVTDSDSEIAYRHIEQIVQPKLSPGETIGSFAWLKNDKNLLLTISSLKLLHRVTVHERIAVAWTSHCSLMSTCEEIYEYSRLHIDKLGSCNVEEVDIENIIYKRALNMYGFQEDLPQYDPNINLEPSNTRLHALWRWIEKTTDLSMVQSRAQVPQISSPTSVLHTRSNSGLIYSQLDMKFSDNNKFNGLLSYLGRQHASSKEEVAWLGVPDICCTTYESMCRVYALQMCGWYSIRKTREENANFKKMLLTCDSVERAAALAVWHLDMRTAIDILRENSEKMDASQDYPVIAMAFSGYSAETGKVSPLWQEVCETLQKSMPNPYLRAAFVFLNSNDNSQNNYKAILKSEALSISDRVGFACLYLPDDMLLEQLTILAESAVECGDLEGVTITGLTSDLGINLLQNYVDKTKDVQTAALALIKTKSVRILKNSKVAHMIDGYRSLLNTWMLWKERAVIDIAIGTIGAGLSINSSCQDLFIHCNYCRKSIQNNARETNLRGRGMLRPSPGMVSKSTSCPSCRKPLPRCSICSICLGTSTSLHHSPQPQLQQCKNNLDHWFTWCPICQHGGHTKHLRTWFQDHIKCPVSGCPCKCWQVKND